MLRSLEQDRAKYAMTSIMSIKSADTTVQKNYKSYVKSASMLILINGLGNALAFIKSKKKDGDAYDRLYKHLNEWLEEKEIISKTDVLEWITKEDTTSLQIHRATDEILALLNWMKRFADAELKED